MLNTQDISDATLFRVIVEGGDINWNFFALKVMISRLRLELRMSNNEAEVKKKCYTDLRELFRKSCNIPNAIKDIQMIAERFGEVQP